MFRPLLTALTVAIFASHSYAESLDDLRAELAKQKAQIAAQQSQLEALATAVENQKATASNSATTVGFYGEVHYNSFKEPDPAIGKNNVHAHRAVILLSHAFNDNLRFYSEIEFEGAADETEIETELEQLFIDWRVHPKLALNIGQFLLPVGLLNESHEPNVFYGVERNPVEEKIIPATWWEKGVMVRAVPAEGLAVDVAVHNGLRGDINTLGGADGLREFRQEFGGSRAEDLAYTLRVKYQVINGLELAASFQQQENITQSHDLVVGGKASAQLMTAHVDYHWQNFGLRVLGAQWDIDNAVAKATGADKLSGFYVEPSWKVTDKVGVFARYNQWNTAANQVGKSDDEQLNVGVNYWIDPRVVLKADIQNTNQKNKAGDGFNLGVGLSF
ncbi:MAG TPA: porin [Agitococcus sp.]|uniref:porin n=1 Tax=uncultured Agitococcus sp. TaxID=1506599 RepID=UPI0026193CF4|nr:porin [uncultured Agitococcus sp.]HNA21051.1 porin [Agitococcus sp.]